jgi:hypothetical protein
MPADYHLANEEIKSVNMQKDLGIFISDDLRWSNQIAHVVAKANRMLGFLRRHCTQLTNIRCRRLLYLTLVRSHLSYGSEIWSPQVSSRDLVLIEGIQRRATKFITQDYHSSYFCRLKSLNLEVDDTQIFSDFQLLTEDDVNSLVQQSAKKSCSLDPMPTSLVVKCLDELLPTITCLVNLSLSSGKFADDWKKALVNPLLQKDNLNLELCNLRPISNLQFISKLTERAVFDQMHNHMMRFDLYPTLQSAYRQGPITETALLRLHNDILLNMDKKHVTLVVFLDLSAAFDTVDHEILISR